MEEEKPNLVSLEGFQYKLVEKCFRAMLYRCCTFLESSCDAELIFFNGKTFVDGIHICIKEKERREKNFKNDPEGYIEDFIYKNSSNLELYPYQVYRLLIANLQKLYSDISYQIPLKKDIYSKIKDERCSLLLKNILSLTESPLKLATDGTIFLKRYWYGDVRKEYHHILTWATNESISKMREHDHIYIDANFKLPPAPFTNCLIVTVYDKNTKEFVPCCLSLTTGKNKDLYFYIISELSSLSYNKWEPKVVTVDFDDDLIKAAKQRFKNSKIICDFYHLKHSIRKKLNKFKVNTNDSSIVLNNIKLLMQIPKEEIIKGIYYIKSLMSENEYLDNFWNYFKSQWIIKYPPFLWNIIETGRDDMISGINYSIEFYNKKFNDLFKNETPYLTYFVNVILQEFESYQNKKEKATNKHTDQIYMEYERNKLCILEEYNQWKLEII